MGIRSHAA